jgi:hypothetical protein
VTNLNSPTNDQAANVVTESSWTQVAVAHPLPLDGFAITYDPCGLTGPVDIDTALAALRVLGRTSAAVRWLHGDLVLSMIDWDLSRMHEAFEKIAALDLDHQPSLMRSISVAYAVPHERRRPGLSWSHHQAVAGFGADEQTAWLDRAEAEGLTVHALEQAIRLALAPPDDEPLPLPPPPKPWGERHRAALAAIGDVFDTDPDAAILVHADGTWKRVQR